MNELSPLIENGIIGLAFDEPDFISSIMDKLETDYFSVDECKFMFAVIKFYHDKNAEIPTREMARDIAARNLTVDVPNYKEILDLCDYQINPRDYGAVKEELLEWLRNKAYGVIYGDEAIEAYENKDYQKLSDIIEEASKIQDLGSGGLWFFEDDAIESLFDEEVEEKLTTGFPMLDAYVNEGGPTRGDVIVWMAPTGVGKCQSLHTKIIVEDLSNVYEIDVSDGAKKLLNGAYKINTTGGIKRVIDLSVGDIINDSLFNPIRLTTNEITMGNVSVEEIIKTDDIEHITFADIKDDWQNRRVYTPDGFKTINDFFFVKNGPTIQLDLDNRMQLKCDPQHKMLANRGGSEIEIFAQDLDESTDKLIGYGGTLVGFRKSDGGNYDLYDISIDPPHWYYTGGVISHNSIVIVNNAAACLKRGLNVLHVTLELSEWKTALRYCGVFSKHPIKERGAAKETITKVLKRIHETCGGDLAIFEYPPDDISIDTIKALVDQLEKTRNWRPDVIAIDYLELMLSKNKYYNKEDYLKQKKVSTEVRQLAKKTGCFIISATQTNRSDKTDDLIDVNRVAESYGKMMPVDYVVSLNQSRDEYNGATPKLRLYIAKNRNGPKFKTITSIVNYNTMVIEEHQGE